MPKNDSDSVKLSGLSFAINDHYLNHLRRIYSQFDGDLEACIVLGEIAHHNAKAVFSDMDEKVYERDTIRKSLKPCNAHSISLSSGIPRETVRRKVKKLEAAGWVTINSTKHLLISPKVHREFDEFSKETIRLFRQLFNSVRESV